MITYKYKAVNHSGKAVHGHIEAANLPDLETRLSRMQLELIKCWETRTRGRSRSHRRVARKELINFCFHMEQMSSAGVPIIEALHDLRDGMENAGFKTVIAGMISSIEGGKTLSEAMAAFPKVFDGVFTGLVRAGEQSGKLSEVLANLTESIKWQDELAAQTKKLLMYPCFVGAVVTGVVFFLMIFLVPDMVSFIQNMGGELPLHTKALIYVSDLFVHYWYVILAAPLATLILIKYLAGVNAKVRYRVDAMKLKIWIVGPILRKIILSRFTSYFALLYSSGVTVLQAMRITQDIVGNAVIRNAIERATRHIEDGNSLCQAIDTVGLFPPLVVRMLRIGENTGRVDSALENVSYFYNREVRESIERLQTIIEPAMTVILGVVLGWVMLSVLGPIYELISEIKT